MKRNIIIILYVVLLSGMAFFGLKFRAGYHQTLEVPPVDSSTNQSPATGVASPSNASSGRVENMMTYGILGFVCLIAFGIVAARDITHFIAHRVEKFVFDEDLRGEMNPEYEEAEKVWANGRHLEAIQLMREYLRQNPREQYVALRIAEIYEKDLGNYVAAALEYEEILKKNLPAERWGWAAIHLANLYSGKMNKTEQATALLRRITTEYPNIAAAKKARERLGEPEPLPTSIAQVVSAAEEAKIQQLFETEIGLPLP